MKLISIRGLIKKGKCGVILNGNIIERLILKLSRVIYDQRIVSLESKRELFSLVNLREEGIAQIIRVKQAGREGLYYEFNKLRRK